MQRTAYKKLPPVGKLIAKCLFENGISQCELAREAGISSQHLSKLITGKSEPRPKTLRKISAALNIPYEEFVAAYMEQG